MLHCHIYILCSIASAWCEPSFAAQGCGKRRKHLHLAQGGERWAHVQANSADAGVSLEVPNFWCCRMYKRHNQGEQLAVVEAVINDLRREMAVDSIT